ARYHQFVALQTMYAGDNRKATEHFQNLTREAVQTNAKGMLFNSYRILAQLSIQMGDFQQAEAYIRRGQNLISEARGWKNYPIYGGSWESEINTGRAILFESKGQYREAEEEFKRAEGNMRRALTTYDAWESKPPRSQLENRIDTEIKNQGRVKAKQG